jgi:hypothetical protein
MSLRALLSSDWCINRHHSHVPYQSVSERRVCSFRGIEGHLYVIAVLRLLGRNAPVDSCQCRIRPITFTLETFAEPLSPKQAGWPLFSGQAGKAVWNR